MADGNFPHHFFCFEDESRADEQHSPSGYICDEETLSTYSFICVMAELEDMAQFILHRDGEGDVLRQDPNYYVSLVLRNFWRGYCTTEERCTCASDEFRCRWHMPHHLFVLREIRSRIIRDVGRRFRRYDEYGDDRISLCVSRMMFDETHDRYNQIRWELREYINSQMWIYYTSSSSSSSFSDGDGDVDGDNDSDYEHDDGFSEPHDEGCSGRSFP